MVDEVVTLERQVAREIELLTFLQQISHLGPDTAAGKVGSEMGAAGRVWVRSDAVTVAVPRCVTWPNTRRHRCLAALPSVVVLAVVDTCRGTELYRAGAWS